MTSLDQLTHELSKLPGIGGKTALRLALYIIRQPNHYAQNLSKALVDVVHKIKFCPECFHITDVQPCSICQNPKRDSHVICVVEESTDLMAIERSHCFQGKYHVLQGSLSPLDGIGPEQLRIQELLARLKNENVEEIILATNPNVTGDATALYISKLIKGLNLKITKLASGLPIGSDIQYIDQMTLSKALELRVMY